MVTKKILTQKDIAKIVGVSPMTISRAVNKEKYVKNTTKNKIFNAINKFGYQPNYFARSLKIKKTKTETIGIVLGDIENPFYARVTKGILDVCEKNNLTGVVCNTYYDKDLNMRNIKMLIDKGVQGVLLTSEILETKTIELLKNIGIPFVIAGYKVDEPDINYVITNNYKGSTEGVTYLLGLGHKKIFYLRSVDVYSANERLRAYKDTLKENKIFLENNISVTLNNIEETTKYVLENLDNIKKFTAIACGNDFIAIGAMRALKIKKIKIPDDVSIIGFDNIGITDLLYVPLTTIQQPKYSLGKKSMEILNEILRNNANKEVKKIMLDTKLIIRESCRRLI